MGVGGHAEIMQTLPDLNVLVRRFPGVRWVSPCDST